MQLVAIVIGLALMEYMWFTMRCGQARGRRDVAAPAMSGDPEFERALRVQYNTLEQLAIFVPSMLLFGSYVNAGAAAGNEACSRARRGVVSAPGIEPGTYWLKASCSTD